MKGRRVWTELALLAIAVVTLGSIAVRLGADGNGDLRNYHLYSGWALLHKPIGYDVAPAQLQTYHHPLLDAFYVLLAGALNHYPRVFTFVWAIPQAVAVWLTVLIARRCLGFVARGRTALALLAGLIGAGGATTIGVVGTSMSEGIPNAALLAGVWLVLRADDQARAGGRSSGLYALAGLLAGAAVVLKLTAAPYLIGFGGAVGAAMLLEPGVPRVRPALAFAACAAAAALTIGGPWWVAVYRVFGNPLFPYYNTIFHSPYYPDSNFFDLRFLPRTPLEWLFYPLQWTLRKTQRVSEAPVRDGRILLELLSAAAFIVVMAARRWRRRLDPKQVAAAWCAVYAVCAYAMWLKMFSILRYASGLETLSGVVSVSALALIPVRAEARVLSAGLCAVLLMATTVVPTWERRRHPGERLIGVTMTPLPPKSTVLVFGVIEKAFIATTQPASVRWIGLENNLIWFDRRIGLSKVAESAVASDTGPFWSITDGPSPNPREQSWIARLHLRPTGACSPVLTTISAPLTLCRLQRDD